MSEAALTHHGDSPSTPGPHPGDRCQGPDDAGSTARRDPLRTRWTLIRGAAAARTQARTRFAASYLDVVRRFLDRRWRGRPALQGAIDDAVQEVFLELFQRDGALQRVREGTGSGFRGFLFGVVRNVALRVEERANRERDRQAPGVATEELVDDAATMSVAFDRSWARCVVQRAAARMRDEAERVARDDGDDALLQRVELLELRFADGLPIREIARRWQQPAAALHHAYAKARRDFRRALRVEVAASVGGRRDIDHECRRLLELLEG